MTLTKRMLSAMLVVCLLLVSIFVGNKNGSGNLILEPKETLHVWYTDEVLEEYINGAAQGFFEETNIRVIPMKDDGLEFLEKINKASIEGEDYPDLYLITNDVLEKAYLGGLASQISMENSDIVSENYSQTAINAVGYKNKIIAYPFYYDTSILLYNQTYLEKQLEELAQLQITKDQEENQEEETTQEEIQPTTLEELIPKSVDDILAFADAYYNAPEQVEAVFKWDVTNIFHNYFFVGDTIKVGGPSGDNKQEVDIYNPEAIKSLEVYQALNQFFSIDPKEVSYESVLQEFTEGKIVFSIVTTDAIAKIEEAKENGEFPYEYGIAMMPDVSESIKAKSMSVTNSVVINGYSEQKEAANAFAKYLVLDGVEELYPKTGKIPAKKNVSFENSKLNVVMSEYEDSIPLSKMIETSNFWLQLEVAFAKIWGGENVNNQLKTLSEQIMTQITGEPFEEVLIEK